MSQNLSSAVVVIGALMVKSSQWSALILTMQEKVCSTSFYYVFLFLFTSFCSIFSISMGMVHVSKDEGTLS